MPPESALTKRDVLRATQDEEMELQRQALEDQKRTMERMQQEKARQLSKEQMRVIAAEVCVSQLLMAHCHDPVFFGFRTQPNSRRLPSKSSQSLQ
jgi:hypothetical protein